MTSEWLHFVIAIVVILVLSRISLALSLISGGLVLGILLLQASTAFQLLLSTLLDPSIVTLALAVGVIPVIGGVMEETGLVDRLVSSTRIGKRSFLAISPALIGLLPMPGGALMSAPFVERAGGGVSRDVKSASNVWFRHIPQLVYPLASSLIVSAKIANVELYSAIPFMLPAVIISSTVGYWLLLRGVSREASRGGKPSLKVALAPLLVIASAPVIDFMVKTVVNPSVEEISTLLATLTSLLIALVAGRPSFRSFVKTFFKMRPWSFSMIIIGMFFFLSVFQASEIPNLIRTIQADPVALCIALSFLLGFLTGRIQIPTSIVIPVFLAKYMLNSTPLTIFSSIYFSAYLGYIASPVHPCVMVSLKYFKSSFTAYLKQIAAPVIISLTVAIASALSWV